MAAVGLVLTHSLVHGFSLDALLMRDSRYTAEAWMAQNLPKGAIVAAYTIAGLEAESGDHK
jgi:hypothetical protein